MDRQLGVLADEEQAKVAIGAERQSAIEWLRARQREAAEIAAANKAEVGDPFLSAPDLARMFNLTPGATR
jgi:hypothetical protein